MRHLTYDMWGVIQNRSTFFQNISSLALTVWDWRCFEDISTMTDWLTDWLTVSLLCWEEGYTVKYSLSTREISMVEGSFVVPLFGDQKSNVPHGFHNFQNRGGGAGVSDPFWEEFHNLSVFLGWLSLVPPWALIKKNFINHSFCRNGAVRNPTGTRLDFLA